MGGQTRGSWFGSIVDPCAEPEGEDYGKDCADAILFNAATGAGLQFGGPQEDTLRGLADRDGLIYYAGKSRDDDPAWLQDGWVGRSPMDLSGQDWLTRVGDPGRVDEFLAMALEPVSGELIGAGGTASDLDGKGNYGDEDAFAMRLQTDGAILGTRQYGSVSFEEMMGVAVAGGRVFIVGQTGGWLGDGNGQGFGQTDPVLFAMAPDLSSLYCRIQPGTGGKDVAQAVVATEDAVYVWGNTEETMHAADVDGGACNQDGAAPEGARSDFYLTRYDHDCNHVWTRQFGTMDGDSAGSIATDGVYLYVVGTTRTGEDHTDEGAAVDTDGMLRVYTMDGEVVGEVEFIGADITGEGAVDLARAVAVDADNVYVIGATTGEMGPGGANLGGEDIYIATLPKSAVIGNVGYDGTGCP